MNILGIPVFLVIIVGSGIVGLLISIRERSWSESIECTLAGFIVGGAVQIAVALIAGVFFHTNIYR